MMKNGTFHETAFTFFLWIRTKRVKIAVFKLEIHKQLPLDVDVDLGFDGTLIIKIIFSLRRTMCVDV